MNYIICHYGEIALKRGNRKFFEDKLISNIKAAFEKQAPGNFSAEGGPAFGWEFVKRISGRILIKLSENGQSASWRTNARCQMSDVLKNIFGIVHFSFAVSTEQNIESIQKAALELLKEKKFKTFRISAKRAEKKFPLNSQQINEKVGEFILNKLKIKVNLENPDVAVFIEIVEKSAFIYLEKIKGPGGLPAGSSAAASAARMLRDTRTDITPLLTLAAPTPFPEHWPATSIRLTTSNRRTAETRRR